ncbi:MAG: SCO family protein [Hyphomicrobiales bacterium]|nr:SCO family protein [Hyphomicrobiales bacterium]
MTALLQRFGLALLAVLMCLAGPVSAPRAHDGSHANDAKQAGAPTPSASNASRVNIRLHDKTLIDQNGQKVRFKGDVVGDHIVVMGFIFTTCTTICPILSEVMVQMQDELDDDLRRDIRMVSISIDPATDTPARLKEYAEKVGAGPEWTWLTGTTSDVTTVLEGLGAYTPDFVNHPGMILVGDPKTNHWVRYFGFPDPKDVIAQVRDLLHLRHAAARPTTRPGLIKASTGVLDPRGDPEAKARQYFTDLPVITHTGEEKRFYSDLLKDKVVLLTLFYTTCSGACPIINSKLASIQDMLGELLGKDIFFVSVSLEPEKDTQPVIAKYARNFQSRDGWSFVTGTPKNIHTIARKLGYTGDDVAVHPLFLMAGDVKRAHWKKFTPDVPDEILAAYLRDLATKS